MVTLFNDQPFAEVMAGLNAVGYEGPLLERKYEFIDYFATNRETRQVAAAAFYQTPISYESACIGVALAATGAREHHLVNQVRALGAPIIIEVDNYEVREWAISHKASEHELVARYPADRIGQMFERRAREWKPNEFLRAKNIDLFKGNPQLSLFAGLLPELEKHIQKQLEPLLSNALATTKAVYREQIGHDPKPAKLFKLIFWILTAKVFHDRRVPRFIRLGPDPDAILAAVAKEYKEDVPSLLNEKAREAAVACIWNELDFRNLSVEVLSQMWTTMLLDPETRQRLGIHRTPRTIVNYIVKRIPLQQPGDDPRIIFEPCSGSAAFLIGVMNALRSNLFLMSPEQRHDYFTSHISALEKDDLGIEISHLALALADWPNLSGWTKRVKQGDVFEPGVLTDYLPHAGVVLCNPPFEDLRPDERENQLYSPKKPVELLNRVLDELHPSAVLGFVLPRNFVDGQGYRELRRKVARRFANIDLTVLPDRAFDDADTEVGLLVATEPIPHDTCQIAFHKVNDSAEAWKQFRLKHEVSSKFETTRTPDGAAETLAVYGLPNVWNFTTTAPTLKDVAKLRRGFEWNKKLTEKGGKETGFRKEAVRERKPSDEFKLGVAPQTDFRVFEVPRLYHLSFRPQDERGHSFNRPWEKPKAIVNKSTHSRGAWRMAAFPDSEGVPFYQTYIGVWPTTPDYDEVVLAAILNSPVANAFVATREGKTDNTVEVLKHIPVPRFTASQRDRLRELVKEYQISISSLPLEGKVHTDPARLLTEIDALVLDGYRMPPRLERELLDFFRGAGGDRPTKHGFGDYFPSNFEMFFSLSDYLSSDFEAGTAEALLRRLKAS
jgi:hypothetical protein